MDWLHSLIGSDSDTILWWQMCIRAVLISLYGMLLIRFGGKRVFGKNTSFDIIIGVILGSILSRALTGNARFIPTLAAATTMVLLHKLMASTAFRVRWFGHIIKGMEDQIVKDGTILWPQMKKNSVTENDLREAMRSKGNILDISHVKAAYIERSGDISVIGK